MPVDFNLQLWGSIASAYDFDWNGDGIYEKTVAFPVSHTFSAPSGAFGHGVWDFEPAGADSLRQGCRPRRLALLAVWVAPQGHIAQAQELVDRLKDLLSEFLGRQRPHELARGTPKLPPAGTGSRQPAAAN